MSDSELTIAILRKIHERLEVLHEDNMSIHGELKQLNVEVGELKSEAGGLRAEATITNQRLSVVDGTLEGLATQLLLTGRYVKNSHGRAIVELRKRVTLLEKKVG